MQGQGPARKDGWERARYRIAGGIVLLAVVATGYLVISNFFSDLDSVIRPKGEHPYYSAVKPARVRTIQAHLNKWGHPQGIYRRTQAGTNVYIFVGLTNKAPFDYSSGPPAYAYSESGAFLDWSPDLGDDPRVHERWRPSPSGLWPNDSDEKISNAEIDRLFPR
jgi:hypothetical protein